LDPPLLDAGPAPGAAPGPAPDTGGPVATEGDGGVAEEDVAKPTETPITEQARTTPAIHRLLRFDMIRHILGRRGPVREASANSLGRDVGGGGSVPVPLEPPTFGGPALVGGGWPEGSSMGIVGSSALMMALLSYR